MENICPNQSPITLQVRLCDWVLCREKKYVAQRCSVKSRRAQHCSTFAERGSLNQVLTRTSWRGCIGSRVRVYSGRAQRERALVRAWARYEVLSSAAIDLVKGITAKYNIGTFLLADWWLRYNDDMILWFVENLNQLLKLFSTQQSHHTCCARARF